MLLDSKGKITFGLPEIIIELEENIHTGIARWLKG